MSLMIGLVFQILEPLTKFNCRIAKMFVRHYGIAVFSLLRFTKISLMISTR